jgi:hypothetical protein
MLLMRDPGGFEPFVLEQTTPIAEPLTAPGPLFSYLPPQTKAASPSIT